MENKDKNGLSEVSREIVITAEDCNGAAEFWTHFDIEMPAELKQAFERFAKEPTIENQDAIKMFVCKTIGHTDHEAFNDEMFTEITEECRGVAYNMEFDHNLESTLSEDNTR